MKYHDFRRQYLAGGLRRADLKSSPFDQFQDWLDQALLSEIRDPTAMVLSTIDDTGKPWQRIVLMKDFSKRGFIFFTNYNSTKGDAISNNSEVSLLFPWNELDRQVIVGGKAEKISKIDSELYFKSRPRESKLVALFSDQSRSVEDRESMIAGVSALNQKYPGDEIPFPEDWGGYVVTLSRIEFWQGGENRLHDRFLYVLGVDQAWEIKRLQP